MPAERLERRAELLGALPSLRLEIGAEADQPQGRQAVVRAVRIGPLLGAEPADRRHGADHRARETGCRSSSRSPARSSPSTRWWRRVRPASSTSTTAAPRRTSPAAAPRRQNRRRRSGSSPSARSPSAFLTGAAAAGVSQAWPGDRRRSCILHRRARRTRAARRAAAGGASSGAGVPMTSGRSWPPPAPPRAPPGRAGPGADPAARCRPGRWTPTRSPAVSQQ